MQKQDVNKEGDRRENIKRKGTSEEDALLEPNGEQKFQIPRKKKKSTYFVWITQGNRHIKNIAV